MARRRSPSVTMPISRPRGIDDAETAEALLGHQQQGAVHRRVRRGERHRVAGMHQVADAPEPGAQTAAWMESGGSRPR